MFLDSIILEMESVLVEIIGEMGFVFFRALFAVFDFVSYFLITLILHFSCI